MSLPPLQTPRNEAPWHAPLAPSACADLPVQAADVPVVEVPGAPCSLAELVALRSGRFVPLFGHGPTEPEGRRVMSILEGAFGAGSDPRGTEHALPMVIHPAVGMGPIVTLARAIAAGEAPVWAGEAMLAFVTVLGGGDALRARVAEAFVRVKTLAPEATVSHVVNGGEYGTWREHYQALRVHEGDSTPVAVARQWFDFVLGRRWSGVDALKSTAGDTGLDATTRWLAESALWVAGDETARGRLTELAQTVLDPLHQRMPRLSTVVARELTELVAHPWELRWDHLRAAAARDHAAASIRAWLHAATEIEADEVTSSDDGPLGPEPSRAARAAVESRQATGEFLLDWFVPEREARGGVDRWAAKALRTWHRLRGAALIARCESLGVAERG